MRRESLGPAIRLRNTRGWQEICLLVGCCWRREKKEEEERREEEEQEMKKKWKLREK